MFHVVLYEPEIPANAGNIIRLCANSGATLHFIRPLGFFMDDRRLRRAGLDYHEWARVQMHDDYTRFLSAIQPPRTYAISTRGGRRYTDVALGAGDAFLFGPESRGLPEPVLQSVAPELRLRIPMCTHTRSLNLANAVAVVLFEAWRQQGFGGAT